ncbi:MAG: hypothetical protein EBU66_07555 [Bacteroidetes bacterium]|nr:hypothetical protein [bacterium]NBP64501.1 hypothetical protein [Bacteroidota bacterium]
MTSVFDIVPRPLAISMICGDADIFNSGYYDKLFDYYMPDMPYGIAKARTGDPDQWILDRLEEELGVYA